MYGVVNVSYHEDDKLIAHLEFEPGLYTNHQMKAIRSEYLKLKGVMFGWVEGTYPSDDTRIVLQFESYLNLLNYTQWTGLNDQYFAKVDLMTNIITIINPILLRSAASIMIAMKLLSTYQKEDMIRSRYGKYTRWIIWLEKREKALN